MLCASLCLSFALPQEVTAQRSAPRQETRKASTGRTSAESNNGEEGLLADRIEIRRKLADQKRLREAEIEAELKEEAINDPAVDLYGEDSWSQHVNPGYANIPNNYRIDLQEFVMPLRRRQVTSSYGYRRRFGRMHHGTDLALNVGDTVRSAFSGKVRIASYERGGYGNYVVVRHANGLETVYGHLHRYFVRPGTVVKAGDPIALGGNTGRSTGPHLHFEARFMGIPIDPEVLFDFAVGAPRLDYYTFRRGHRSVRSEASVASVKASKASDSPTISTYRVRKGDTLHSIAKRHGTTASKLARINGISTKAKLKVGRSLRVS